MISRTLENIIKERINKGKAIIVVGPRQVGKTTLIQHILKERDYLSLDGDIATVRELLSEPNLEDLKTLLKNYQYVFIDEAQRIQNIGITLKIIVDNFKDIQLLVSGSSAFELNSTINEPLTGRKWEYKMYPISWAELENNQGFLSSFQQLEVRLIYGFYPDILNHPGNEIEVLNELTESYLYKDILAFGGIRKPEVLEKLLRALAFQVGSEVSYNELAQLIGIDKNTVANYIQLLEQSYVVFSLHSFSRNLRNEIKTNRKIYFYDNGIRNAIIQNFNPLELRQDKGAVWENFLISERIKFNNYSRRYVKGFFWRTFQQQEIDYLEEANGKINAFEFKWNPKAKAKIPENFVKTYGATFQLINKENFRDFLL